jgi:putative membrane protein
MSEGEVERTLILCIDGDNDIGRKAHIETPILSRNKNLEAATSLAVSDPEEADANAMFGAVKLYDQLTERYPNDVYQVATIAGDAMGGIEADRKMVKELESIIESFGATSVILVTDGYSDEDIMPLIQSRIPITSVQHVVVKHSERIEETWAVLLRYFRMLIEDPYYSRVSLGVPGLMLIILGILTVIGQLNNAGTVLSVFLGFVLIIKGFGLDERLSRYRMKLPSPARQLYLATAGVGVIVAVLGLIIGMYSTWGSLQTFAEAQSEIIPPLWEDSSWWLQKTPFIIGNFLLSAIDFVILGAMVSLIGGIASHYLEKDIKMLQSVVGIIVTFWLWQIAKESARVLLEPEKTLSLQSPLVIMTMAGVLTTIMSVFFIYGRFRDRFPLKQDES